VSTPDPNTAKSGSGPEGGKDVQSDPAKGNDDKADWTDEGGATPSGPADEGDQTQ
jgi:hypothetical protein